MTVDYATGEIVPVDTTSEVAVTGYLQQARDWLATAVEQTGPEQIAAAKAEIATAAEATKQLGLSKEIQLDAQEMVRRAEYALGKAIRKGQAEGEIAKRGQTSSDLKSPQDFGSRGEMYGANGADGLLGLADSIDSPSDFDDAIAAAKAEGNLSRANVTRKAAPHRARPSKPAETTLNLIESRADQAARAASTLTADQIRRVKPNAAEWIDGIRKSVETLQGLLMVAEFVKQHAHMKRAKR